MISTRERDFGLSEARRKAGSWTAIAKKIGLSPAAVAKWERCPPWHVPAVSELTGVPRHVLRPDLYEAPEGRA